MADPGVQQGHSIIPSSRGGRVGVNSLLVEYPHMPHPFILSGTH